LISIRIKLAGKENRTAKNLSPNYKTLDFNFWAVYIIAKLLLQVGNIFAQ
jgi:hypothetical protein